MIDNNAPPQIACMIGYRFDEFCATTAYGDFLRSRYQEVNIPIEVQTCLVEFPEWLNWVVIIEEDAPDSLAILPILQRMAEFAPRSSIYIFSAEDDLTLVDGALEEIDLSDDDLLEADLPMLFFCSDEWQLLSQWGPRPQAVEPFLDQWLEQNPTFATLAESEGEADQQAHAQLLDELTYEMRVWYISELDHECSKEIKVVLENLAAELEDDTESGDADDVTEGRGVDMTEHGAEYRPTVGFEQDEISSEPTVLAADSALVDAEEGQPKRDDSASGSDKEQDEEQSKPEESKRNTPAQSSSSRRSRDERSEKEARPRKNDRRSRNRSGKRRSSRSNRPSEKS